MTEKYTQNVLYVTRKKARNRYEEEKIFNR